MPRLTTKEYFTREFPHGIHKENDELLASCPFHDDSTPSFQVNLESGKWICRGCGKSGNRQDFIKYKSGEQGHVISEEVVSRFKVRLFGADAVKKRLEQKYGWAEDILEEFRLGYDGDRVCVPIEDAKGNTLDIRRFRIESSGSAAKVLPYDSTYGKPKLFPLRHLLRHDKSDWAFVVEGEKDCISARGYKIEAYTSTGGASSFNDSFVEFFRGLRVAIVYDCDDAGISGSIKVANLLFPVAAEIKILKLPFDEGSGDDLTDFFLRGATADDLFSLLDRTDSYEPGEEFAIAGDDTVYQTTISDAGNAIYRNKMVKFTACVIGKETMEYILPEKVMMHCGMSAGKKCAVCPMYNAAGKLPVMVNYKDPGFLTIVGKSNVVLREFLREKISAGQCGGMLKFTVIESINAEEITLIPLATYTGDVTNAQFVLKRAIYLGHDLESNQDYEMIAFITTDPDTQHAALIITEILGRVDFLKEFKLNPELDEQRGVNEYEFCVGVSERDSESFESPSFAPTEED